VAGVRAIGRRPTLWVELAVAAAWLALMLGEGIARGYGGGSGGSLASGPLWICTTGLGGIGHDATHAAASAPIASASLLAGTPMWVVMALAMMVPTAMPAVQHVAGTSLYWRRRRAAAEFLVAFLALWTAFGVLVLRPLAAWHPAGSRFALAVALAAAALWQLTPLKLRALRACHRSRPLPPRGWRAPAGVADFGLHNGAACLASCWAMMAAAAVSGSGRLLWMGALTGAMTVEKLSDKPLTSSRRLATLLAAAALGVTAAVLLQ
jgi:predicted metal-binding membrane protein